VDGDEFLETLSKMSGDGFDANGVAFPGLPDLLDGYGLTKEDFWRLENEMMKRAPKETVLYVMYLSTRNFPEGHMFTNEDALKPSELAEYCDDFLREYVELA
jgi:hypothetical protein